MNKKVWAKDGLEKTAFVLILLLAAVFLRPAVLHARQLGFTPVFTTERKTLELDWDTSWFSRNPSEYNHDLARLCCFLSDVSYSVDGKGEPGDIMRVYRELGAEADSIRFLYGLNYDDENGNDQCAYSMATIILPDGSPLVVLTVRGTPAGNNEWLSNLNIANSKADGSAVEGGGIYHEGFFKAEQTILNALLSYVVDERLPAAKVRLLVTGHSRGAAVANLIGMHVVERNLFDTSHCYVYTIACPNVASVDESYARDARFSFIWNIVNAEDIVPSIPFNRVGNWNYRKFGTVKVLSNSWSAGRKTFKDELYPKMDRTYRYLTGRHYQPSGTGPFIQIQLARLLAQVNPDVDSFYKGMFSLHRHLAKVVPSMFPTEEEKEAAAAKKPGLMDRVMGKVDEGSDGFITKVFEVVNNLHQSESYLSFLMGLDESECFNSSPSVQLVIRGLPEAAVLDSQGNELTRIKEGQTNLFELHESMSACRLGVNVLALGFPVDEDFEVVLTDTAIIPNPVTITSERYSADGVMMSMEEEKVYACRSGVYSIRAGRILMSEWGLDAEELKGAERKVAMKKTKSWSGLKKRLSFEADIDTDLNLGLGLSYGTKILYGLALYRLPLQKEIFGTWEIDAGLGHKEKLWNATYLNGEILCRGVFVPDSDLRDESEEETGRSGVFSIVPAVRLSLAWQPLRKAQVFASLMGSLFIKDFNDAAFESHRVTIRPIEMGKELGLVVSMGLGVRF
ncbi:MAG: lipase family protein [Treponema sp.]|nr:lipase family protein [Treponema sp.]